jgi:hypothetical protein
MPRTQHKLITALVAALLIVPAAIAGAAAVDVSSEDIQVDGGENVTVDVEVTDEFINDGQTSASVDVQLEDDTGSVVNSTTLTVDDTAFGGTYSGSDTVFRTAEFAPAAGNYTVVVNATAQDYVNSTNTEVGTTATGGGLIGGASSTGLIAFAAVVGGLAYAYREDYL